MRKQLTAAFQLPDIQSANKQHIALSEKHQQSTTVRDQSSKVIKVRKHTSNTTLSRRMGWEINTNSLEFE